MGIFDKIFKNKEKEDIFDKNKEKVVAPVVNKDVNIYDKIKTLIKENKEIEQYDISKMVNMPLDTLKWLEVKEVILEGVNAAIDVQKKREDINNLIVDIPLEYRPLNKIYIEEPTKTKKIENAMYNQFLVINDITKEEQIKFNSMLDGFKDKVGTEWLLGFVDFMEEVNKTKSNNLKIENKDFVSNLNLEGNIFKQEPFTEKAYQIVKDATALYINGTHLNATFEDKFNKGDYIIEDNFGKFINVSKEDFEAKYKVIEKESFDNIIDETKKVLNDKSNEYNDLKKELENAKVEIERLREKLNGIENNFKSLS